MPHHSTRIALILIALAIPLAAQIETSPFRNTPALIGRSDIILARPNFDPTEAMPLGNGRLGAAAWSAGGLTVQLNRGDTLPELLPVARVSVPGLKALTGAADYSARLSLYDAEFQEQGAGIHATVFVDTSTDTLIIDVTGAIPGQTQTAKLTVPPPQKPTAEAAAGIAVLSRTWLDDQQPGASGRGFGALAALTAQGREVASTVVDSNTVAVTFRPDADGHFRILVAAPRFNAQSGAPAAVARQSLGKISPGRVPDRNPDRNPDRSWWHDFWQRAAPMRIASSTANPDGSGEYMENLRALYLYSAASESGGEYPGSQAGVADLLGSAPKHNWDPAAFWHWNLRMQVAANLSAGVPELNAPYCNLYRENLTNIEAWTREHMKGLPGICIPETMRFNGPGIEYETWNPKQPIVGLNCDAGSQPYYNARTLSTGAEVSLWIWRQYLATRDRDFLLSNFPVMAASARFLVAYETGGPDGRTHTAPSNAHETQWDTADPTTDLAARAALYDATAQAAKILAVEPALASQLSAELAKIPPFPRTTVANDEVIADSYRPAAENHNVENIGLEPVWPFDRIGDTSPLFALAQRTYRHRPYPTKEDWSFDPIQAARLQMPDEVRATLVKLTETYQTFVNGYSNWGGDTGEFYIEQQGVVAAALSEALVQDYDGLIRIAPAWPAGWDVDGQVAVRDNTRVTVSIRAGKVEKVVIEAGATGPIQLRNPWGDSSVDIAAPGKPAIQLKGATLQFDAVAGEQYRLNPSGVKTAFAPIPEAPAAAPKKLGPVQIGIFPSGK